MKMKSIFAITIFLTTIICFQNATSQNVTNVSVDTKTSIDSFIEKNE